MRECAICGQPIFKGGICSRHWYEYQHTPTGTFKPKWLVFLISEQRSFERKYFNNEILFCELNMEDE